MDRLIKSLNGGVVALSTGHAEVRASARNVFPADTVAEKRIETLLVEEGVAFAVVTRQYAALFEEIERREAEWHFPVGSTQFGIEQWYIATHHLERGSIWKGGIHTGIDWNVEVAPRGDIDRGQPTYAVADGVIHGTWYSEACLGSVVYRVQHDGLPLWVRHWHLAKDALFLSWQAGMPVEGGYEIGNLGDYAGGDHLHFDMCVEAFHPGAWWAVMSGVSEAEKLARWVDPVGVLKAHLDPELVDAALRVGG